MPDGINTMGWDMSKHECEKCGGPRSRRSKGLCQECYRFKKNPDCSHHWVFDAPKGPTSAGICKLCGERNIGMNSIHSEFGMPLGQGPKKERGPEQAAVRAGREKYQADSRQRVAR